MPMRRAHDRREIDQVHQRIRRRLNPNAGSALPKGLLQPLGIP